MSVKSRDTFRIFISYASEDRDVAKDLISDLAKIPSLDIFVDNQISAGENWQAKIKKQLSKSDYFLVLLSPDSINSKWVQFELGAAWGLNKDIIPVVTNRELIKRLPLEFDKLQIINLEDLTTKPESIHQIIESYEKTAA